MAAFIMAGIDNADTLAQLPLGTSDPGQALALGYQIRIMVAQLI